MATRYFEYRDAKSAKFWEVSVTGKKVTIRYGKIGTDGQTSLKELSTPAAAKAHAEKQAAGKVKKGYTEAKAHAVKKGATQTATNKTDTGATITSAELKQYVRNIKKFLTQRDYAVIDSGIELARSLDDAAVFDELLKGCSIDTNGELVKNKLFTGTGPAQPYLDYALLGMLSCAPQACAAVVTLRQSIPRLHLSISVLGPAKNVAGDFQSHPAGLASIPHFGSLLCTGWRSVTAVLGRPP